MPSSRRCTVRARHLSSVGGRNKASRRETTIKFTAQEWADIGITKLRIDSYVRAANGIFYKLNHTTSQPKDIPGELKKYYEMLFSEKRTHAKSRKQILGRLRNRRITEASAAEMDRTIEDEEVQKVMERLPLRKQAGPNRVPNAVYRCLSIHFAPKLAAVLREAIKGAPLPPTLLYLILPNRSQTPRSMASFHWPDTAPGWVLSLIHI